MKPMKPERDKKKTYDDKTLKRNSFHFWANEGHPNVTHYPFSKDKIFEPKLETIAEESKEIPEVNKLKK